MISVGDVEFIKLAFNPIALEGVVDRGSAHIVMYKQGADQSFSFRERRISKKDKSVTIFCSVSSA